MPRFATSQQITELASWQANITAYQTKFDNLIITLAGYIEAFDPTAGLEIRYITGQGIDDENWRGNLLAKSQPTQDFVNLWCLTITGQEGLPFAEDEATGSFDKPFSVAIDYFYDWSFGTDVDNTEEIFNQKITGFDRVLEQIRTCLPDNCEIESWSCRRAIKRFTNASTHVAKFDLNLKFSGM